jgi:type I restriction enzyme S subunit
VSFSRYPSVKDSGVEWWGVMPNEWGLFPAKRSFVRKKELNPGMKCENRLSLTLGGVVPRDLGDLDGLQAAEFETYQIFFADDLVFKLIDLQNIKTSRVGLVPELGIMSPAYIRIEPNKIKVVPKFAYWFFTNLYNRCIFNELGGGVRQTISSEELLVLPYPALPLHEQTRIAEFLDRETAKIDELVAEQRRLMELLKEKRQAVISHAVTKGLNPKAKLKPSGIEWLGDVPAHWDVKRVKHLVCLLEQGWSPQCEGFPAEENEWGVLKVGCVNGGIFNPAENKLLPAELEPDPRLAVAKDDLLISRANTRELVGSAAVAERGYPKLMVCDKLYRIHFHTDRCNPRFISHYMGCDAVRGQIELDATGASASMVNIGQSVILELTIATPLIREQTAIVAFLEAEIAKFDTLTAEAQRAIDLLQERRTALISAAVTGQIDVRGLAVSAAEPLRVVGELPSPHS